MDGIRFDDLARLAAVTGSRRRLLGALVAGTLGLGGQRADAARRCRPAGDVCRKDGDCCSKLCGETDATGRRRCECVAPLVACGGQCVNPATFQTDPRNCGACGHLCPRSRCELATCTAGACGLAPDPAAVGLACTGSDPCIAGTTCQVSGACGGGAPVVCPTPNECYAPGACDPVTGCGAPIYRGDGIACGTSGTCLPSGCCDVGHEILNGSCWTITTTSGTNCPGCPSVCIACAGSISGSSNFLCVGGLGTANCTTNADCGPGKVCRLGGNICYSPC